MGALSGQRSIGVNQGPGGGSDYPFAHPSEDIIGAFGDLYLAYSDRACAFTYPLRLAWMYGFNRFEDVCADLGDESERLITTDDDVILTIECPYLHPESLSLSTSLSLGGQDPIPGFPVGTHDFDVLIVDADNQVVFDSTTADVFLETEWGDRLLILEWRTATGLCRATVDTSASLGPVPVAFPRYLAPADGVLDARTYERVQDGVTAFNVDGQTLSGNVRIQAGYNLSLVGTRATRVDGTKVVDTIDLDVVPNAGMGRSPGCAEADIVVRTIAGVAGDASGNFTVDAEDCVRTRMLTSVTTDEALVRTAVATPAAMSVYDNCPPCNTCEAYVRTYNGLRRTWNLWKSLATQAESARDFYARNRQRWLDQKECRQNNPFNLLTIAESSCRSFVGASYSNFSACCLQTLEIRFTFTAYAGGAALVWGANDLTILEAYLRGRLPRHVVSLGRYDPIVTGPVVRFFADSVDPRVSVTARMRIVTPCTVADSLGVTVTSHHDAPIDVGSGLCDSAPLAVPGDLQAIWAEAGVTGMPLRASFSGTFPLATEAAP